MRCILAGRAAPSAGSVSALVGVADVLRGEVVAQPLVAREAQRPGVGDVAVVDRGDQLRLDEVRPFGRLRLAGGERAGVAGQRREQAPDAGRLALREAAPPPPAVGEAALVVVPA